MSIDTTVYIGPYPEVTVKVIDSLEDQCGNMDTCPNPKSGFCSRCGIEAAKRFVKTEIEEPDVNMYDLFDQNELTPSYGMSPPKIEIEPITGCKIRHYHFVPNIIIGNEPREFHPNENHQDQSFDWTKLDIQKEIKWFQKEFKNPIKKLEKVYGNVEIKRGYIQWCS